MTDKRRTMTHDEAVLFVADDGVTDLDEERRAALQSHRADCPRCASLGEAYSLLSALKGSRSTTSVLPHPPSDTLVRSALDSDSMDPQTRREVEKHLLACAECADDVDAVREADRESRRPVAAWSRPSQGIRRALTAPLAAALAAILILGIWGAVAARQLYQASARLRSSAQAAAGLEAELARSRAEMEAARAQMERVQEAGGIVRVFHLGGPRRGEKGTMPVIRLDPEDRYAILSIGFLPSTGGPELGGYRCGVYGDGRRLLWETLLTGSRVRAELGAADEVSLAVPTRALEPGELQLECRSGDAPATESPIRLPFRVEAEPAAGQPPRGGAPQSQPPEATNPPQ